MEDIEYLDEYKDLVLPGIKVGDVRQSGGARRRRISSDSSNSSSLDADIFQKLFLDKSVDDDLLNLTEGASSKSHRRRHRSPSSSDDSNDALDALFNRKLKSKPNKRRERFSSFDSVDDLGQALMRSTQRLTVPKPSTSQARAKKSHSDALYRSSSSSNSSARGKSATRKQKPAAASSGKGAAGAAPILTGKYKNPSKPNSVNGSSNADKGKAVTILKAQKTDLKPTKHEPKTDPLNLTEFFEDSDSDSSYSYESDFFDDHDSVDEDAEPVIDISTDTSRTTSVADTVTPVVSDDDGQEPQREQNEENEQNGQNERSQASIMNSVYERLQSYLNNLSCAEPPPIYKKQSFTKKSRSSEKKPSSSEQVKHAKEQSAASGEVREEKEKEREPTKACGSSHSSPAKSAGRSTNSLEENPSASASASRRLFEVDDGLTLETLQRMTQDLAEQILEIDVERSVEYQKRSGSKHRSRSRSKISGEPGPASDLATSHVRKLTYSSERLDNGCQPLETQLRRSKSESAFPKRGRSRGKKARKSRAATTEDNVLSSAKEGDGEVPVLGKRKRGRPRKKTLGLNTMEKAKSTECVLESVAKDQEVSEEKSGVEAVKEQDLGQQEASEERELNSELEKAKDFTSQEDISISSCHQETDLKSGPDRSSALGEEDDAQNLEKQPHPAGDISTKSFDSAEYTGEVTDSVTRPLKLDNKECLPQPEKTEKDHRNDATMAIKELEEIENAIETAGEIAMTPELADALDGSTNVQATPVTGNILEESDSQLAEDIKLAEEILAAEVGKGIEVTEAATATEVGDQNPVIDIVKELEQETISEVVGNSDESSFPEGQTEVEGKSPIKEKSPIKDKSPIKEKSPIKGQSPAKCQSPAKRKSITQGQSPGKGQSKVAEQSLEKEQSTATENSEVEEPSVDEEQSKAERKSPVIEDQVPTKESLTETENPLRLDTPTKKANPSSPAKFKELEECKESSIARRILRSDKPESKPGTPVTTPIQKTSRKSRGKLPLKSDLTLLKDDSSRRSSPRLGRSPAESHSSQERSKLTNEKSNIESKSPAVEIAPKDKIIVEGSSPVKDLPVTDSNILTEEKPGFDETDANKVDVKPLKKRGGRQKRNMAKSTEELSDASKLIDEQPTSSEQDQKDEPAEIHAVNTSELPAEQPKASEPPPANSDADQIEEKPSSSKKSRSRRSRWDLGTPESNSATEKIHLRTNIRGSDMKPETKVDDSESKGEQISGKISRGEKLKPDTTPTPAKSHSSRGRGTTKETPSKTEKSKERSLKECSKDRNVKSKSETVPLGKDSKDKTASDMLVDGSSDQTENETKQLSKAIAKKMNPTPESTTISNTDLISEHISLKTTYSAEKVPQPASKAEPAKVIHKPDVSGVKRGRIKKRRQAVSVEDSEYDQIDAPSQTASAAETQINAGKRNQSPTQKGDPMLDTEPLPPPPTSKDSEQEAPAPGPKKKTKKKNRKSTTPISASATNSKESIPLTTPAEPISQNAETMTDESAPTDAKNTSSNSPSKFKDNVSEELSESKGKPKTPSTSLPCRKLRVLLKRTPTSNLMSKGKTVGRKGTSKKRKNLNKILESIEEGAVSDLVHTQNKPVSESQPICESDPVPDTNAPKSENTPNPVEEEVSKHATEEPLCDVQENLPKNAIDDDEEVPRETATEKVTDIQEEIKNITQEHEADKPDETASENTTENATTKPPVEQNHENETPNSSSTVKLLDVDTTKKENREKEKIHEEEIHLEEKALEVEETCQDVDTTKAKETPEDRETPIDVKTFTDEETPDARETPKDVETSTDEETLKEEETPEEEGAKENSEPSGEPLREDLLAKEIPTEEPENSPTDSPASPTPDPDPRETETTGVTVVAPEASTNSRVKRSMRQREADSSRPDEAAKKKLHIAMKSNLARKREQIKNARRRNQQEEKDHPALKRTKTDSVAFKLSERGKTISMIGNETIMTSPSNDMRSEQPQTSQAAKRTGAASKGSNYAEITKHVIIPAPAKKHVDGKPSGSPTKKPMLQTLLSSTLNLRKPLPGEGSTSTPTSGSGLAALGRKSMGKAEVEASKAKSQPTLNNSLVLTKKAVLPASKKNESPTKEDKSEAIGLRKVNISVSLLPPKDNSANNSLNKSLETSVLPRKVQLVEAQKTARKSEVKKKVEPKGAAPETPPLSSLDKNKPKVVSKSAMAVDNSAKKMDSPAVPAKKSLQVEVPKKTETRKSEGQSSNSRKAPLKADTSRKIETRKSEGSLLARKVMLPKESVTKEPELQKSADLAMAGKSVEAADVSATDEVVTVLKDREKPTVAVTPRTVNHGKSIHMTRAASSSRSLAPTPALVIEGERTASKERLPLPSTQRQPELLGPLGRITWRAKGGRFKRVPAAFKRKALEAAEANDPKRAKEEQKQPEEGPDQDLAFPVKITAAGLSQQVDPLSTSSKASPVSQKQAVVKPPIQEVKHRKLRIRINRHVVSQWLKDHRAKKKEVPPIAPAPAEDMASDTESAAESMSESINISRTEPPETVLMPPVPPLAPIKDHVVPLVVAKKDAAPVRAQVSVTSAPVPPAPVPPAPVSPAPVLPAPVPSAPAPLASVQPTPPAPVPSTEAVEAPVGPPLTAEKGPTEGQVLEDARRLAALRKVQMHTILPMPLPVPIPVAEVKSEPDDPPEPMEEDIQVTVPVVAAPPSMPQAPVIAESTPPVGVSSRQIISVISASTLADRPALNDIPSASAPGNNANSFGHTKMFSFLYPNRHSGNYGEVGLDFCCPNLEGPMAAIDPTRLHAKVEAPVLEMPQFLVITTKFISKADKNIPNKVRAKLELLGKDKELSSSEPPATILNPPAPAALPSPVPIPQNLALAPLSQSGLPLPAAPPIAASTSTPTPAVPASSIDSLTKQLPRGTTLTKKVHSPGAPVPPTSGDSMATSLPLSLIQLPTLCPTDQQRTELQARVQVFDLVLQALSRRVANLTVAERQRTIEEIVKTSTLMPIDVDVGTKLLENYVHYLNKATSSTPVPPMPSEVQAGSGISPATPVVAQLAPTVATSSTPALSQSIASPATPTATPQPDTIVIRKPVFDPQKNIIGFKSVAAPNVKATPRRKAPPGPVPAATSTPLAASTSSAAASADSKFVEIDRKTVKACQRQMINLRTPAQKSAAKGSIIAIRAGSKAKITNPPVGKATSPAIRGPAARGPAARQPASRSPAMRGPPPLKLISPPRPARCVTSGTIAPPSLTRTANPNVFIINQASHVEESILPDSNNVVAPMEAEIKGELDDTSEAII